MRIDDIKFVGNATAPPPPQSVVVTDVQTACGEYTWLDGNTYTTSNNTATYTVPSTNPGDPDTNLTLNLTILPVENVTADTTVNDYEFSWCGTTYTQHGELPPCTLQTAAGCDSIVTLNLTLNTPCVEPTNFTATLSEDKSKVTLEWAHEYAGATFNITRNGGAFQEGISGTTFVDESGEFGAEELTYVITTVCLLGESDGVSAVVPADIPLPVFADTIAEACGEFTWYGTTFTTTGDYPRTITGGAASGADSTITLHLTINTAPTNEIAASITQGDVYAENGFNIPTTDLAVGEHTYPQTITGGAENGCDSTVILTLTIVERQVVTYDTTVYVCEGPYVWNNQSYDQSGVYNQTFPQIGYDSVVNMTLVIPTELLSARLELLSAPACNGQFGSFSYEITGGYPDAQPGGNYYLLRVGYQGGADYIEDENDVLAISTTTISDALAGTYTYFVTDDHGCTATATIVITEPEAKTGEETITACDSYEWNGQTYTVGGDYPVTLQTAESCDSVVTLHLTINTAPTNELAATITQGDVYAENGFNIQTADLAVGEHTYPQTITGGAANGCDSTVILTLTIVERQVVTYDTTVYVCEGPYVWNNQSYDQSGVYNQTFPQIGYDSVVNMTLVIPTELLSARLELLSAPACNGQFGSFSYEITGGYPDAQPGGNYYLLRVGYQGGADYIEDENDVLAISTATISDALAGTYTYFVTDDHGCTATATIVITEPAAKTGEETITACDSYEWNGQTYNVSNDYPQTLQTAEGCDSAVTLHLTIDQSYNFSYEASIYEGQTYTGYGFTDLATAGEHQLALHTVVGHCDSVINLTLTVIPVEATELLCAGDTTIAVPYGVNAVSATELLLDQPTPLLSETATLVSLTNDAPEQFTAGETYTITWTLTYNEIGSTEPLTLTCTQNVTVQLPPCGAGFTVSDSEGNIYQTTRIGYECWMAENLRATQPSSSECALMGGAAPTTYVYNTPRHSDEAANLSTYGRLYTWYAAVGLPEGSPEAPCTNAEGHIVGLCPDGWYLPTVSDYITIAQDGAAGLIADQGWLDGANGTNNTGFNALPAGCRTANGSYTNMLGNTYFWTSTTESVNQAVNCKLSYSCPDVQFENSNYTNGYSVRCVKE